MPSQHPATIQKITEIEPVTITLLGSGLNIVASMIDPPLDDALDAKVSQLWEDGLDGQKAKSGTSNEDDEGGLFNGTLFNVHRVELAEHGHVIYGGWTEYRRFYAQQQQPDLYGQLRVRPLAVTGLLACQDGIVVGQRSGFVFQDANKWELTPSGSIDHGMAMADDTVSFKRAVLTELEEELGLQNEALVYPPHPFALVQDNKTHVIDIGLSLMCNHTEKEIQAAYRKIPSPQREYRQINVVTLDELGDSIELTPVSSALITAFISS
jgi:hypothetical protein